MISAIAGGKNKVSQEEVPVMFRLPPIGRRTTCQQEFSALGYGDIVIPGIVIAYLRYFDLRAKTGGVYFTANLIGKVTACDTELNRYNCFIESLRSCYGTGILATPLISV